MSQEDRQSNSATDPDNVNVNYFSPASNSLSQRDENSVEVLKLIVSYIK
jgi:hypothetical protein